MARAICRGNIPHSNWRNDLSKDQVGFKVTTDAEKHAKALLDKKLVQANDVSVRPIALSQKSIQDLIDKLRDHEVPFRALLGVGLCGNVRPPWCRSCSEYVCSSGKTCTLHYLY
jgi:hypothetical protein